jgi:membrane protein insertase Oxa1/YidC/SpoIIIJ
MSALSHFLKEHSVSCSFKKNFHIQCPGCGFQRSFIALIEGNFTDSLKLYPALIPLLSLWLILVLHLIFKFRNGAFIIKYLFLFCVLIIFVNYLIKIINQDIFT